MRFIIIVLILPMFSAAGFGKPVKIRHGAPRDGAKRPAFNANLGSWKGLFQFYFDGKSRRPNADPGSITLANRESTGNCSQCNGHGHVLVLHKSSKNLDCETCRGKGYTIKKTQISKAKTLSEQIPCAVCQTTGKVKRSYVIGWKQCEKCSGKGDQAAKGHKATAQAKTASQKPKKTSKIIFNGTELETRVPKRSNANNIVDCSKCKGVGRIELPQCLTCGGKGRVKKWVRIRVSSSNARRATYTSKRIETTCTKCQGKGAGHYTCPRCAGRGTVRKTKADSSIE